MKFSSIFVLGLAGLVAAKGHEDHQENSSNSTASSTKSQCKKVAKLTAITDLAANTTRLNEVFHNNATKIADFQAKAANATSELNTLKSNTTLMGTCNVQFAAQQMMQDCETMVEIQRANMIVNNATLLAKLTNNNATKAEAFKAKVAAKAGELNALQSNTTLTGFCAGVEDKASCKAMAKLAKEQALAANTTALNAKLNGDADKIAKFQAKVAKKVAAMQSMMSNNTLLSTCQSLGITLSSAATNGTSSNKPSAANSVNALGGGQIFAMVSALVYALTML